MSGLRIAGLAIGIIGLIFTFLFYRGPKWKRLNFIFYSVVNVSLIAISINPNIVNFLRDLLALQQYQYGRILALLIISNIVLMFISVYTASKVENSRPKTGIGIFRNSFKKFEAHYDCDTGL
jgi:hypothetical protein